MACSSWFSEERFGLFIHWGLYAIPARGEWVMQRENIPPERYEQYFAEFNPAAFDARAWARAAKQAGMRYAILTAKHHDGFCLFDSKLTDYKVTNTALGRDVVREFLDAMREQGIRVGLYYSLLDWHHPDYPKYDDIYNPMYQNPAYKGHSYDFDNYLAYMHGQVEELVTGYGKLDALWFDFSYGELSGEAWKASELAALVRRHQPDIVLNNRLDSGGSSSGSLTGENPPPYSGDFVSPEQALPVEPIRNVRGELLPWEACFTLNNSWGYNMYDTMYKRPELLVHKLVECVSKGGNMLLNVGPDANGRFPQPALDILEQMGDWLGRGGASIYGCGAAELPRPEWGRYTQRGNKLYAHLFEEPIGPVPLAGLAPERIKSVRLLCDGGEVRDAAASLIGQAHPDIWYVTLSGDDPNYTRPLPDPWDTVLEITLAE